MRGNRSCRAASVRIWTSRTTCRRSSWGSSTLRLAAGSRTNISSASPYYGRQPLHAVLERTTWHVAQHARQLQRLLELRGVEPRPSLAPALLAGLPLPEDVWDAEVPLR